MGLSYNLSVMALPSFREVVPGMAEADGMRLLPARGQVQPNLLFLAVEWLLPLGLYAVRVQAVDAGLAGGEWSDPIIFEVLP
jgi:hypothetical protein